jgi:hypothetical protein
MCRGPLKSDPKLAVPNDLLEGLPISLTRDRKGEAQAQSTDSGGIKIYRGHRDGSEFVIQAQRDTLVIKQRFANGRAKTYQVTVGYTPTSSPWTMVEKLCRFLRGSDQSPLYIGDMVAEMRLLRETTALVSQDQRWSKILIPVQYAALAFIADHAEIDGLELLLTFPFQISIGVEDNRPVWNGYILPKPLDDLRPTTVVFENRNAFCFRPIEVGPGTVIGSPIEAMKQLRSLADCGDELH